MANNCWNTVSFYGKPSEIKEEPGTVNELGVSGINSSLLIKRTPPFGVGSSL